MYASYWLHQIVIGWLTFDMTGSAILTSIALGLDSVPTIFMTPIAGIIADRWERRYVIAVAAISMAVITLGLGIAVWLGTIEVWHIFGYALLIGIFYPLMDPAWVALMMSTVPKKSIVNAFVLNKLAGNGSRLVVPTIGGLIIVHFGPGQVLVVGATLYALTSAVVMAVTHYEVKLEENSRGSAFKQFWEGLRYVGREPIMLVLLLMTAVVTMTYLPSVNRLMPVYATDVFSLGPTGLGLLMGVGSVGSTFGMIALISIRGIGRRGRLMVVTILLASVSMVGFSLAKDLAPAMGMLLLINIFATIYWTLSEAVVMEISPSHLRGRVASLVGGSMGLTPLGSVVFGGIADVRGPRTATFAGGLVLAASIGLLFARFRQLWSFR